MSQTFQDAIECVRREAVRMQGLTALADQLEQAVIVVNGAEGAKQLAAAALTERDAALTEAATAKKEATTARAKAKEATDQANADSKAIADKAAADADAVANKAQADADDIVSNAQKKAQEIAMASASASDAANAKVAQAKAELAGIVDAQTSAQGELDAINAKLANAKAQIAELLK